MDTSTAMIVGGIASGAVLKTIDYVFARRQKRADFQADDATQIRKELRDEVKQLRSELRDVEKAVDSWRERYFSLLQAIAEARSLPELRQRVGALQADADDKE